MSIAEVCFALIAFLSTLAWALEARHARYMTELVHRAIGHMRASKDVIAVLVEDNRLLREQIDQDGEEWKS